MFSCQLFKLDYEMYATGDHFRKGVLRPRYNYCYLIAGFTLTDQVVITGLLSAYIIYTGGESAISPTYWLLVCSRGSKTNTMHVVF